MADRQENFPKSELAESFRSLQSLLFSVDDLESFLQQLAGLAAHSLDQGPVACGITLRRDGQPYTVASSDEHAAAMDETQYQAEEGPCLHALRTGEVVWIPDINREQRWPDYLRQSRSERLGWSLSMPLRGPDHADAPSGALNVYGFAGSTDPDAEQRHRYELFAAQAAGAIQLATRTLRAAENRAQLEAALSSRSVIDQALGILMSQHRCTAEEAFGLLRRQSQHSNVKLRDVAAQLIEQVTGHSARPGTPFMES